MGIEKKKPYYRYEAYEGRDAYVALPDLQEGHPLTVIGAKAFLSCRTVERLELPDTLEEVEDWGFAHMKNLRELVLPPREIRFGKKVFLGCENLTRILLRGAKEQYAGIPFFLASWVRWMNGVPAELTLAGDSQGQWQWLDSYDKSLVRFLSGPDDDGFEPAFMGVFYVEDVDSQRHGYMTARKKCKIRLALQRLRYSERLSLDTRRQLEGYLLKDEEISSLFLGMCREEYAQEVEYFQVWQQIGGFSLYSPQFLLEQLPEADPEVRGFLMKWSLSQERQNHFFGELEL